MRKLACIFLLLMGCSEKPEIPENIYPVEKMSKVLTEIHILDRALVNARIAIDTATALYHNHYLPIICEKYNVTKAGIDSSLKYYVEHVDENESYRKMYEIVNDSLSMLEIRH